MGDRTFVVVESREWDSDLAIYSHWGGVDVYRVVADVLAYSTRIGDPSYLTASIIHALFTEYQYDGQASFGVFPIAKGELLDGDNPTVVINADSGVRNIGDTEFDRWGIELG